MAEEHDDTPRKRRANQAPTGLAARLTPLPATPPKPSPAPVRPDADTREFLNRLRRQQLIRAQQGLAEAQELGRQAKELERQARQLQRLRIRGEAHEEYVRSLAPKLGFDPNRPIAEFPPLPAASFSHVETVTILPERSYIRVLFDAATNGYLYQVIEPKLTKIEEESRAFLRDTFIRTLAGRDGSDPDRDEAALAQAADEAIVDHAVLLDDVSKARVLYYLQRDFLGYGPIDALLRDPMIEDISCDGPRTPIYLFHRQYESVRTNVVFPDDAALDSFVIGLAQRCGKQISIADPLLDATLPDGSRLQATLSREVTTRGSTFTIRKFRTDPLTPTDLVRGGTLSAEAAAYFWLAMETGSSVLFAGGTASGKTTTLNAMSIFIPPQKKIVSIEDTREINLPHENWIPALTRAGVGGEIIAGQVAGSIDMYRLLEVALRQRPEYLIVGEVRGREASTLFQAMATGHATYSTLHADSVPGAIYRLESPPINVPRIMLQTLNIIAVQTQARLGARNVRRVREIVEIIGQDPDTGDILTNTVFRWDPATDTMRYLGKSHILDRLRERLALPADDVEKEWANRAAVVQWLVDKGVRTIQDVANVVSEYYRMPEGLLERVRASRKERPR